MNKLVYTVRLFTTFIFILLTIVLYAQETSGIRFSKDSWQELLLRAKNENKIIFVDVYTDWCGPCKRMDQDVFPLSDVGKFFNLNFINYRLNAEKGEGPELAKKYGVKVYPTWLFVLADGTLKMRGTDFMESSDFINLGKRALALDFAAMKLSTMEKKFNEGAREIAFLRSYLQERTAKQLNNSFVLNAYIQKLDEHSINAAEVRRLIDFAGRSWSSAVPVIVENIDRFEVDERKEMAGTFFNETLYFIWGNAMKDNDLKLATKSLLYTDKLYQLFDDATKVTADHVALLHGRKFKDVERLKNSGCRLAKSQMAIDTMTIRHKNLEMFKGVMKPFLTGERDSTKIPNFAEEKKYAASQYSAKVAGLLYEVAEAYHHTLPSNDPALKDALIWAQRAYDILPSQINAELVRKLHSIY